MLFMIPLLIESSKNNHLRALRLFQFASKNNTEESKRKKKTKEVRENKGKTKNSTEQNIL